MGLCTLFQYHIISWWWYCQRLVICDHQSCNYVLRLCQGPLCTWSLCVMVVMVIAKRENAIAIPKIIWKAREKRLFVGKSTHFFNVCVCRSLVIMIAVAKLVGAGTVVVVVSFSLLLLLTTHRQLALGGLGNVNLTGKKINIWLCIRDFGGGGGCSRGDLPKYSRACWAHVK